MPPWAEWTGFVIGIVGFVITIWQVIAAKQAAQEAVSVARAAHEAASRAYTSAMRSTSTDDLLECINTLEDLKSLHRVNAWPVALERYGRARRSLVGIGEIHPDLNDEQKESVQFAIRQLHEIERRVEQTVAQQRTPDAEVVNRSLRRIIDKLVIVHTGVRKGSNHG